MQKVITFIFVCLLSIGLVACSNEQAEEANKSTEDVETEIAVESVTVDDESEEEEAEEDSEEDSKKDSEKTNANKDITDYEEALVIEDTVDIADMDVEVKTDNQNKRVLLFSDDNEVMYKTVYIKKKQRLKIIDIYEDQGQIFNDIIEVKEKEKKEKEEKKDNEKTSSNKDIADYDETGAIEDTVDITDMDVKVKTDNQNNRVLLFSDDNEVMYKTVYIKKKQRLKIINIYEDKGQIFNDII